MIIKDTGVTRSTDSSPERSDLSKLETDVSAAHFITTRKGCSGMCMTSNHLHVIKYVSHHRIPSIGYCLERSKHNMVPIRPEYGMAVINIANYEPSMEDSTVEAQGIFGAEIRRPRPVFLKSEHLCLSLPFLALFLNVFVLSLSCLVFVFVKIQIKSKS